MSTRSPFNPDDISDWFWSIIQCSDKSRSKLHTILEGLSNDELHRFALEFMYASDSVRDQPFIDHVYTGQWKSEDDVADMSYWVVSQGKEFYLTVWHHPEAVIAYEAAEGTKLARSHSLEFVAENILSDRLDADWPDTMEDYRDFLYSGHARVSDYMANRKEAVE